jgi:hypothetical protein
MSVGSIQLTKWQVSIFPTFIPNNQIFLNCDILVYKNGMIVLYDDKINNKKLLLCPLLFAN